MFIRTKFHINRLTQTYFTAFLYVLSDHPSYMQLPKKLPKITDSDSVMVRASASGAGGRGFDPGPGHTKAFKNGTSGYLAWRSTL